MINRRDFIRTSVLAGGALFAQTAIPSGAADFLQGHGGSARPGDDGLLKGVCDIHLPAGLTGTFGGRVRLHEGCDARGIPRRDGRNVHQRPCTDDGRGHRERI